MNKLLSIRGTLMSRHILSEIQNVDYCFIPSEYDKATFPIFLRNVAFFETLGTEIHSCATFSTEAYRIMVCSTTVFTLISYLLCDQFILLTILTHAVIMNEFFTPIASPAPKLMQDDHYYNKYYDTQSTV